MFLETRGLALASNVDLTSTVAVGLLPSHGENRWSPAPTDFHPIKPAYSGGSQLPQRKSASIEKEETLGAKPWHLEKTLQCWTFCACPPTPLLPQTPHSECGSTVFRRWPGV